MSMLLFASEPEHSAEGLAAFGVDWKMLLLQALTFLLVVLVLKKFVVGKVYEIIDTRQSEIDEGLNRAEQAKKELAAAQDDIDKILGDARVQAEQIVAGAKKESNTLVKEAEQKAATRAEAIVADAQAKLAVDVDKARADFKAETARLIGAVAEVVLKEKLTADKDAALIASELERKREK